MNTVPINSNTFNDIQLEQALTPMKTGKAKGWIGTYHWVSLPVTEQNKDIVDKITEPTNWCNEYFGKSGARWFEKDHKFFFKDEKDMSMFILRWAS